MKNINNFLLNHRFIFQDPAPKVPEAPKTEKPDDLLDFLDSQPPLEDVLNASKQKTDETETKGGEAQDSAKTEFAKTKEGAKTDKEGKVVRLDQITIEGERAKLSPKALKLLKRIEARFAKREGKERQTTALMAKYEKKAGKNADVQAALQVYKLQKGIEPVESGVASVEQASEILTKGGDEIGKKTLAALGSHYRKLANLKDGPREIYRELVSNITKANEALIRRGATADGFEKFNADLAKLIANFKNIDEPQKLADNATNIGNLTRKAEGPARAYDTYTKPTATIDRSQASRLGEKMIRDDEEKI